MNGMPNESKRMLPNDQIESPLIDEDISEGSLNAGNQVLKKGPWTTAEDAILVDYVKKYGEGNWNAVQKHTGLSRCGKSCRLRWANHLRPNLKKGAFTPEEEQLIIELHAKMGNKWARMAAYLPGRTDNEIKNYWNTRIKRRRRAGLPLYPPNICFKVCDENQQSMNTTDYSYGDKLPPELLGNNFDIPAIIFDNFDANHGALSFGPPFQDIPVGNMLRHSFGSHNNAFTNPTSCAKELRDSESLILGIHGTIYGKLPTYEHVLFEPPGKVQWNSVLSYPYDPDPSGKSLGPLGGSIAGSHSNLNGTFSASSPACGTMKLELPSLQYKETDGGCWFARPSTPVEAVDAYVESPPTTASLQSECISPCNSGLLEALLHEAQALGNERKQATDKITSCFGFTPNATAECSGVSIFEKLEEHNDPISPFGHSASSLLTEHTHPISGSSLDEFSHTISSSSKSFSLCRDCSRPDALLGSVWLEDGSRSANDHSVFNDAIAILLGRDFCKYKPLPSETSSMLVQGFGLDFEPWDNMPHTCQMP